ncbi:hypothetical protein [Coprobacter secundus]|jgi:hypothetical protein|uniref:hypothetical protein n=1 Tax=Coprobacter secundus TaxID=1501392 RepID=UPI0005754507|nr:hypothetical protein PU94_08140 [Coprobacter secundus]
MDSFDIKVMAEENQRKAFEIINDILQIVSCWESISAVPRLVGSLSTGLLMKHRDIDFHIYSFPVDIKKSFKAIAKIAEHPRIIHIEYTNLLDTDEACIEWHALYEDKDKVHWQIDMIHIEKGSKYDGYFENVARRINEVLTPEMRMAILSLKYFTPDDVSIMGIEYYKAVIKDGVRTYPEFLEWRKKYPVTGIEEWCP